MPFITKPFANPLKISLFSVDGRNIYTKESIITSGVVDVPISRLKRGIYLVKITEGNGLNYIGSVTLAR